MTVSQQEVQSLCKNKHVAEAMELTFASILSYPDGKHQIENGGVEYTPKLSADDLVVFCQKNIVKYKKYRLKNAARFNNGEVISAGVIPAFSYA